MSDDPKGLMRRHLLTIGLILIGVSGCDNVAWDGIDLAVLPPPAPEVDSTGAMPEEPADDGPTNEHRPVLLAGLRDGARATLTVVGEVDADALSPFPDPRFPGDSLRLATLTSPGAEWILFSEGTRIGRLFVDRSDAGAGFCGDRTTVSGIVELVPSAAGVDRLLALPYSDAADRPYLQYTPLEHNYNQRIATLDIAQQALPEYGAPLPRQGVLDARRHIQSFDVEGQNGPYIAATFLNADDLVVGPPGRGAYSLFVLGEQAGGVYRGVFTWFRAADTDGKGAPRYFDHLDWNGDGVDEILLEVFGGDRRWFASLSRRDGAWVRTFQDACGTPSPIAGG